MAGYDPRFIGDEFHVPLPTFQQGLTRSVLRRPGELRDDIYYDGVHFTLVMNEKRRTLIYAASNIDQSKFREDVPGDGKKSWGTSTAIGGKNQLNNDYYKDRKSSTGESLPNPYDRGHMVMRYNNMWGDTDDQVDDAGKSTFVYANASLQHENLNRDEWKALEIKIFRTFAHDANDKLSIFTGPIYGDLDRHINLSDDNTARVPSGFFKVLCFQHETPVNNDPLGVLAFAIFQDDEVLRDKQGGKTIKLNTSYQVTISELQNWTGINFGDRLYTQNPLFYHDLPQRNQDHNVPETPERIPIINIIDPVVDPEELRCGDFPAVSRPVIIQSAMVDPSGDEGTQEWVSLHNRTNRVINIDGWTITDHQTRFTTLRGRIPAGESKRVKGQKLGSVKLANTGGALILHDDHECIIDYASWSEAQIARNGEGVSLIFDQSL